MENGLYLLEKGKVNLARNFIYLLNNFYWQSSCKNSSHTDTSLHTQTYDNIVKSNSTSIVFQHQCISTASSNKSHLTYLYMHTALKFYLNQTLCETLEREIMIGFLLATSISSLCETSIKF